MLLTRGFTVTEPGAAPSVTGFHHFAARADPDNLQLELVHEAG
jgi:hypothetical protein